MMQPAVAGAARQPEITERPMQRHAGAPVANHGGEPAAVVTQLLKEVAPWRLADAALDSVQIEQRLPRTLRAAGIVRSPFDLKPGEHASLALIC